MPPTKVSSGDAEQMRDMLRVQRWTLADIARRFGLRAPSTVLVHVRILEVELGLCEPARRRYVRKPLPASDAPPLFATQRELLKRRADRIKRLDTDPDVLRCREERDRAIARRRAMLDEAKRELQAFEVRASTWNNRSRRNRRTA